MYLEKYYNPGKIINLDHVASMNWDNKLSVEFIMANGQIITWTYDKEEDQMQDLDNVGRILYRSGKLISFDRDQG